MDASGSYSVTFKSPASWTFSGSLGSAASSIATANGSDKLGSYCDTSFTYSSNRNCRIRAYAATPVVVFSETSTASVSNTRNFPKFSSTPKTTHHITYQGPFIAYSFSQLVNDSPFIYFDDSANAFIVSAANHFPNTQTVASGSGITSGIQSNITTLPANYEVSTIVVGTPGINAAYEAWGQALLAFGGKTLRPNDATPVLNKIGAWLDNTATYYYRTESGKDYRTTMKDIRDDFTKNGVALGYMQLDSWWYPKGSGQKWDDGNGGFYKYEAHPTLFPDGLAAFQKDLALPLIVHNRWLDASSPYRDQYQCSGNTVIDPAFWADRAKYLKDSGVVTYEQDWLSVNGWPNQNNLTDQEAYLDNQAKAMDAVGIDMQYCMPVGRHIMQSSKLNAITNSRVSSDGFDSSKYKEFFYGSRLVWSVRLWPWVDVYMSTELDNILLSTLTAGLVGPGDPVGGANWTNIKKAVRPDGVIVKPDIPILLNDSSIIADSKGGSPPPPLVGTTYTQHSGGRFTYVYTFGGNNATGGTGTASFTPSEFGHTGKVYVYDVKNDSGKAADAATAYSGSYGYYMIAPIGTSGIALLGDKGKFVPMGKKRISAFTDDGTITATVQYASGEGPVTIQGYAAAAPTVTATSGTVGSVSYSASTQRFTVPVTASGTSATIQIKP